MRNILFAFFSFLSLYAGAQLEDVQNDIVITTSTDTSWRQTYRATPEKINNLVHTKLDVRFDYEKSYLYGKAWITLTPHFYPTDSLRLDAKGMDIKSVNLFMNGKNMPLKYIYDSLQLNIKLNKTYTKGQKYIIFIDYTARPNEFENAIKGTAITDDKGLYFINPKGETPNKPTQIWTQGETESNSVWFPTIDRPNQKMTQEIAMTVPNKYVTLSNGLMVTSRKNTNNTRTDIWKLDLPHAPYLVFMGVGDYAIVKDKYKNIEVDYYVEKEYAPYAKQIFGLTPEMIDFYSKMTGVEYVWPKYAQITGRDYVSGAMENTTATLHQESAQQNARELADGNRWEDVISHELFHHWFGDLVTAESWSNLTLNESFANYSEYLWQEYKYGKDTADVHWYKAIQGYLYGGNFNKNLVRFHYKRFDDMFDGVSYNKGGAILHMLRKYIGDDAFFAGIKKFLTDYKFGTAEAHELRQVFESVTGKDLNWFFNQWYFNNGHPELNILYTSNEKEAAITIEQTQKNAPIFKFPTAIDLYVNGKKTRHNVWIDKAKQTFSFPVTGKVDLINFDADKTLLCTKKENKKLPEYIYQYKMAENYMDRREAIAYALANALQPAALDFLVNNGLKDKSHEIRMMILYGLDPSKFNAEHMTTIENMARTDTHRPTRAAALDVLAYAKNVAYIPIFEQNIRDSSYSVSGSAIQGLFAIDREKALTYLPELKKDAKGKLKVAVNRMEMVNKTDEDFDAMLQNYKDIKDGNLKAEYTFDFMGYLTMVNDTEKFKKGIDEILKFSETISRSYPEYGQAVRENLRHLAGQKSEKKTGNPNAAALQQQIDYINQKIK